MGENIAIRDAYGAALKELGEQNEKIVGLEADVASSTKSGIFGKAFPERYFNVGISELDMVSMSAGFAREGLIPYVNTFAVFLTTRGADPIQSLIAYDKLNVKLCGTYCGLSDSYDGASHYRPGICESHPQYDSDYSGGRSGDKKGGICHCRTSGPCLFEAQPRGSSCVLS